MFWVTSKLLINKLPNEEDMERMLKKNEMEFIFWNVNNNDSATPRKPMNYENNSSDYF